MFISAFNFFELFSSSLNAISEFNQLGRSVKFAEHENSLKHDVIILNFKERLRMVAYDVIIGQRAFHNLEVAKRA